MSTGLYQSRATLYSRMTHDFPCKWMASVYGAGEKNTQAIGLRAFRSIMMWVGVLFGCRINLHNFRRGPVTAIRYRYEVLDPTANNCILFVNISICYFSAAFHVNLSSTYRIFDILSLSA